MNDYNDTLRQKFTYGSAERFDYQQEQQFLSMLLAENFHSLAQQLGIDEARDMYTIFLNFATEEIERRIGESVRESA